MDYVLAAILWCAPAEPIAPEALSCVAENCTVDYDCGVKYEKWACHCCQSTPGKKQVEVHVCNSGQPPVECRR